MSRDLRSFTVTPKEKGQTLAAVLKQRLAVSWSNAKRVIDERRVCVNGQTCADAARRLQPGMRVEVRRESTGASPAARRKPDKPVVPQPNLVHLDVHIVVVEKPPGATTMRHAEEA